LPVFEITRPISSITTPSVFVTRHTGLGKALTKDKRKAQRQRSDYCQYENYQQNDYCPLPTAVFFFQNPFG
jgi:hypothetical protein